MTQPASFHPADVDLALAERGDPAAPTLLVLHGGGGPASVAGFADARAAAGDRVLVPTHPGFQGTPRPEALATVPQLAGLYAALLADRGLRDVLLVGFSMGGWIAAELALRAADRLRGLVLVDAVGIEVPGEAVADVFSLAPRDLAALSWADPARFFVDPATFPPERAAAMAANFRALAVYGRTMVDPGLAARLADVRTPALVAWGAQDRVCTPRYGRAWADALADARFALIEQCGHLPQIEQPARLAAAIGDFEAGLARPA